MSDYKDEDDLSDKALSPAENKQVRRIIRDDMFARRFWSKFRVWAGYLGTAIGMAAGAAVAWKEWRGH